MRPLAGPARCTGSRRGEQPPWDQVAKAMSRRRVREWLCARASQISAAGALAMPQKLNWSRLLRPECALALQTLAPRRPQIQLDASVERRLSKRLQECLHRTCRVTGAPGASSEPKSSGRGSTRLRWTDITRGAPADWLSRTRATPAGSSPSPNRPAGACAPSPTPAAMRMDGSTREGRAWFMRSERDQRADIPTLKTPFGALFGLSSSPDYIEWS